MTSEVNETFDRVMCNRSNNKQSPFVTFTLIGCFVYRFIFVFFIKDEGENDVSNIRDRLRFVSTVNTQLQNIKLTRNHKQLNLVEFHFKLKKFLLPIAFILLVIDEGNPAFTYFPCFIRHPCMHEAGTSRKRSLR